MSEKAIFDLDMVKGLTESCIMYMEATEVNRIEYKQRGWRITMVKK